MVTTADNWLRTTADAPLRTDVAVGFGAGLLWNGEPSMFLANRLDTTVELYRKGRANAVLVTGNKRQLGR
ncbi:hypothetical protein ACFV1X_26385 [Streptomyces coelicoflavus]|uniref:hypothetical protein n=1 Tax=Streptomyces coelicoflavus TaxID=285562 RepID=UPI0036BA784C